jgi:hypothetical protein
MVQDLAYLLGHDCHHRPNLSVSQPEGTGQPLKHRRLAFRTAELTIKVPPAALH